MDPRNAVSPEEFRRRVHAVATAIRGEGLEDCSFGREALGATTSAGRSCG